MEWHENFIKINGLRGARTLQQEVGHLGFAMATIPQALRLQPWQKPIKVSAARQSPPP